MEAKQLRRCLAPAWMLSMTLAAAFNAHALGLGEIQVSSNLGQPLSARIAVRNLSFGDAHDLRVHLASIEEYRKIGLQYPDGIRFNFQFVNDQGKPPFIDVSTLRSIDEPFVTLLLEVSAASGKITKEYTFLLDPPPELFAKAPAALSEAVSQPREVPVATPAAAEARPGEAVVHGKRAKPGKKRLSGMRAPVVTKAATRAAGEAVGGRQAKGPGALSLALSTSLSISRGEPGKAGAVETVDELKEELIAREKIIADLNAQINEMQVAIKALHFKIGVPPGAAAGSGVPAQVAATSAIPETAVTAVAKPKISAPAAAVPRPEARTVSGLMARFWARVVLVVSLMLLAAAAVLWLRQRRSKPEFLREEIAETVEPGITAAPAEPVTAPQKPADLSIKQPGTKGLKSVPVSSQEYDYLEQAEIYLRFGHDKLAEDVLRKAINVNPINPHGYLTLLGIYETRGDAASFYALAQQLKAIGDPADWRKVAEMGRKLDPDNPFYA
ncbi:MAG TPA: hypothetical protein VFK88_08580 [Gallionella sp.]|nr:hypothetical protein [Gallionella sp.]